MSATGVPDERYASVAAVVRARQAALVAEFERALREAGHARLLDGGGGAALRQFAQASLDDLQAALLGQAPDAGGPASLRLHPRDGLPVAVGLFDVIGPVLLAELSELAVPPGEIAAVITDLHRRQLEHAVGAAMQHIDHLLDQVESTQADESLRIHRELSQRVVPGILAVGDELEVYEGTHSRDAARASLRMACDSLQEILGGVREIHRELRPQLPEDSPEPDRPLS